MVDVVDPDGSPVNDGSKRPETDPKSCEKSGRKLTKRKRAIFDDILSREDKESVIAGYRQEIDGLLRYFKEVLAEKLHLDVAGCCSIDSTIACLLEGSPLPYSKLVGEIYEKLKVKDGVTLASVRSSVLSVGQRSLYGIANADADVLEDESESCLPCWESRDMKLLPIAQYEVLKIRRICRKKIHERIDALSAMLLTLSKLENHHNYEFNLRKASEKIGKAFSEAEIRSFVENLLQKSDAEMGEKEAKLPEKLLKESKKIKQEIEKEKKRMDRGLQKEKGQNEKEVKRLKEEFEKGEKRREKENTELRKQLKRKRDEAEKDQRRREKEESELKEQLALQKQASIMNRFLKGNKKNPVINVAKSPWKASESDSTGNSKQGVDAATSSMDAVFSQINGIDTDDLLRSHLIAWHKKGQSIRHKKSHWSVRREPKVALFSELKLQGSSVEAETPVKSTPTRRHDCSEVVKDGNDQSQGMLVDVWEGTFVNDRSCYSSSGTSLPYIRLCNKPKKLLQFDKSPRPPYYGTSSRKSGVVGQRRPFKRDPNLDYDVESDEEWEEDEPGESLSDCDKDDEEENLQDADEDASEDSFMVPDGYLSENEGVQIDTVVSNAADDEVRSSPSCLQDIESGDFIAFHRQQKHLNDFTELALRRNQPLIISNLMHEKDALVMAEDLSGSLKLEQTCLQALRMRSCFGGSSIEISADPISSTEDKEFCQSYNRTNISSPVPSAVIMDFDLREVVSAVQSCPHGINKVVESLQKKFPMVPKTQLKSKVREVSNFVDNRWQVKKEILDKLGLSASPEKSIARTKGIATFFSKRCLPPARETIDATESSQLCHKPESETIDAAESSQLCHKPDSETIDAAESSQLCHKPDSETIDAAESSQLCHKPACETIDATESSQLCDKPVVHLDEPECAENQLCPCSFLKLG